MTLADYIGTVGVTILLIAFFLNLTKKLSQDSPTYMLLNFSGALVALISVAMLPYWPFIVLEGVWMLVSLNALIQHYRKK